MLPDQPCLLVQGGVQEDSCDRGSMGGDSCKTLTTVTTPDTDSAIPATSHYEPGVHVQARDLLAVAR